MRKKYMAWYIGGIFSSFIGSPLLAQAPNMEDGIAVRLPVWTEELGEVNLDDYTHEELNAMTREYWTPERIRNAKPAPMPIPLPSEKLHDRAAWGSTWLQPQGMHVRAAEPVLPLVKRGNFKEKSGSLVNMNSITNGKLYFTDPETGEGSYCSASAVNSSSKRLIATAAHCINSGGPSGQFFYNFRFVPAAYYDEEPLGSFGMFVARMPPAWILFPWSPKAKNSDFAFLTTYSNDAGWRVVEWVGGHGIDFNSYFGYHVNIFGYPQNLDQGDISKACAGSTQGFLHGGFQFFSIDGCNFGTGASGGPWLTDYNLLNGLGIMRTVSSWVPGLNDFSSIRGPYFGDEAYNLYLNADNDWVNFGGQE